VPDATVYLVRHGEVHNPGAVRYGRLPGFDLSDKGRAQAAASARWIAARGTPVTLVASSPLVRAESTARVLAHALAPPAGVELDPRLIEIGSWLDGLPRRLGPVALLRRVLAPGELVAERWAVVAARVRAAVDDAAARGPGGAAALVSHQLPIQILRLALERGLGAPGASARTRHAPWSLLRARCDHASVTVLRATEAGYAVAGYFAP
jgi:broad specificity phosphatase PhoE